MGVEMGGRKERGVEGEGDRGRRGCWERGV